MAIGVKPIGVQSIAAKTKDSGTFVLRCAGAVARRLMLDTIAIELAAEPERQEAVRKVFPPGIRVRSLVLHGNDGRKTELLDAEVLRCEECAGKAPGPAGGDPRAAGVTNRMMLVLRTPHTHDVADPYGERG